MHHVSTQMNIELHMVTSLIGNSQMPKLIPEICPAIPSGGLHAGAPCRGSQYSRNEQVTPDLVPALMGVTAMGLT